MMYHILGFIAWGANFKANMARAMHWSWAEGLNLKIRDWADHKRLQK